MKTLLFSWFLVLVASAFAETVEHVTAVAGNDITLSSCGSVPNQVWIKKSGNDFKDVSSRVQPLENGQLFISDLHRRADSGVYSCRGDGVRRQIKLDVKAPPSAVVNMSVIAHSVFALVTWQEPSDPGGFPILNFVLTYRLLRSHLNDSVGICQLAEHTVVDDVIPASSTSRTVYHLCPNSTYSFRMFAVNELGNGDNHTVRADTVFFPEEVARARELCETSQRSSLFVKVTLIATVVILVTFTALGIGICLFLCQSRGKSIVRVGDMNQLTEEEEEESMELVPHITLNPSFNIDMLEYIEASPTSDYPQMTFCSQKRELIDVADVKNNLPIA